MCTINFYELLLQGFIGLTSVISEHLPVHSIKSGIQRRLRMTLRLVSKLMLVPTESTEFTAFLATLEFEGNSLLGPGSAAFAF